MRALERDSVCSPVPMDAGRISVLLLANRGSAARPGASPALHIHDTPRFSYSLWGSDVSAPAEGSRHLCRVRATWVAKRAARTVGLLVRPGWASSTAFCREREEQSNGYPRHIPRSRRRRAL